MKWRHIHMVNKTKPFSDKTRLTMIFMVLALFMMMSAGNVWAQENGKGRYKITGQVIEVEQYNPIEKATIQLRAKDSTYIDGVLTNDNGNFTLFVDKKADYQLVVSSIGYSNFNKKFTVQNRTTPLGIIRMQADTIMLDEAVVTGSVPKVQMVADTVIYNADAYRLPEGAVLEELIERLPGAEIEDGKITINGKEIKKIMLDGKDFFRGSATTATKNLPSDIVDKLKVYDEKSDMARITGIDDGEENHVIDIRVKKGMNIGFLANGDLGYGTSDRYSGRLTASTFSSKNRVTFVANGSNINGSGRVRGGGGGGQGLRSNEQVGMNYNYDEKRQGQRQSYLKMDGNANWNHGTTDQQTRQSRENYEKVGSTTYSNSLSKNLSKNHGWSANFNLEWRPDTMTHIQFRPNWSLSNSDTMSESQSMQYSANPFDYTDAPLDLYDNFEDTDSIRINRHKNQSISHQTNRKVGGSLQWNRRFGNMGRNLTFRVEANYNKQDRLNLSNNMTHLYKMKDKEGNDSIYYTNRYSTTPSHNYNMSANVSYSEPLMRATFLQFNYRFNYSQNESDQKTYDFSKMGEAFGNGAALAYGGFDSFIGDIDDMDHYENHDLSRYSKYQNFDHDAQVLFRMIRTFYNFSTGIQWRPQRSHYIQDFHGVFVDTVRVVNNFNPTMSLRVKVNQHTFNLDYHGNSSQPGINQLLDITDDTNPLNISKGNPGLKPSWTHNLRMSYNDYFMKYKQSIALNWDISKTTNAISSKVTYNDMTGGRITQPENINGNWRTNASMNLSTALDQKGRWNINSNTTMSYNHLVSYLSVDRNADSKINNTNNTTWRERLSGSFRNDWLDVELNGSANYSHVRNMLQARSNRDTWNFSYGGNVNIRLPWDMTFDTSISQNMRRGYTDASANTNELIWNAQISQSLMKRRRLVLSLQVYDILGQQKSFNYVVNSTNTTETHYNSITQYVMLHVIFNFRQFGGKAARDARRERGMRGEGFGGQERGGWDRQGGEGQRRGGWGGQGGGRRGGGFGGRQ